MTSSVNKFVGATKRNSNYRYKKPEIPLKKGGHRGLLIIIIKTVSTAKNYELEFQNLSIERNTH